ncbi:uncharacterized protein LOC133186209 [Saccostrea echinata]|uniref:uncharacterized protein LOC133186209 n=1 Tax=Saccostrea echinata TaxID=191078 RepID=UPI002A813100|nr:uncharacterized protein LOC133186209 [Saccostrea echinata]
MEDASGPLPHQDKTDARREEYHMDFQNELYERMPPSTAPSGVGDDSGLGDGSEPHGGLIDDLLGPHFRSRFRDSGIHIHIGTVHYHREPPPLPGMYRGPVYHGLTQQPPQPCSPLSGNQYASSPALHQYHQSSSSHVGNMQPHPSRSGVLENFSLRQPNTVIKGTEDETHKAKGKTEASTSNYISLAECNTSDTVNSMEGGFHSVVLEPSEQIIDGVPTHYEVNLKLSEDDPVMYTGELKCVPSVPDVRPPTAALHRPRSTIYINSAYISQNKKTVVEGVQEADYVNYNQPFTKAQAYRIGSAGAPGSPPMGQTSRPVPPMEQTSTPELRMTTQSETEDKAPPEHRFNRGLYSRRESSSEKIGGRIWRSAANLSETVPVVRPRESSATCSKFTCISEGFHPDIEDDNEKAHIKECLHNKGKSGNWVVLTLQNHPVNRFCLEVKYQDDVLSFPVMLTRKRKYKIDPSRKGFKCLCKLIDFYKKNKLPSCNVNLGSAFPKSSIPPTEAEADCSDEVLRQYAGIRL